MSDFIELWKLGIAQGKQHEQERIIKLLDENLGNMDWDDLICLIRGGNNDTDSTRS